MPILRIWTVKKILETLQLMHHFKSLPPQLDPRS